MEGMVVDGYYNSGGGHRRGMPRKEFLSKEHLEKVKDGTSRSAGRSWQGCKDLLLGARLKRDGCTNSLSERAVGRAP